MTCLLLDPALLISSCFLWHPYGALNTPTTLSTQSLTTGLPSVQYTLSLNVCILLSNSFQFYTHRSSSEKDRSQQHSPKDGFSLFCWFEGSWTTHVMSMQTPAPREGQRVIMRLQGTLVSLPLVAQAQQTSLYGISLCSWAECFLINLFLALRESLHSNSPSGTDPRPHIQISVDLKTQTKLENLKA